MDSKLDIENMSIDELTNECEKLDNMVTFAFRKANDTGISGALLEGYRSVHERLSTRLKEFDKMTAAYLTVSFEGCITFIPNDSPYMGGGEK
jgi:hypothetical protein|tara:strand:+ start:362 stop:637 length:276 start_codon:yes stop_codon:yes gene_type:complete